MRLDTKKEIKRLVIYFFYDADGIVDRYVPYMLEDINRNCSELFVVVNGKLTPEGRKTFKKLTPNILVRENVGFDVWAYKTALEHYGWDKLAEYDEVVLMNSTIIGPFYPLSEMFAKMNGMDLDFWGITKFHENPFDPFGTIEYGYIPEHIQSHFIAVRKNMLESTEFSEYWISRPEINRYADAIGKHEAIFTKHFTDMGFVAGAYADTENMRGFTEHPILQCPKKMLKEYRCPIIKRRSFFNDYFDKLQEADGSSAKELLEYIANETDYSVDLIWENILRTCHMRDIMLNLNLNYVLSSNYSVKKANQSNIALVIHIYFEDLIDYCIDYAKHIPYESDLIITTDSEKKKSIIQRKIGNNFFRDVKIIVIENRGRDVSALLVGVGSLAMKYEYICFMHDKKSNTTISRDIGI